MELRASTQAGARLVALAEELADGLAAQAAGHDRDGSYPFESIDDRAGSLEPLLDMYGRDQAAGLGEMPYPPDYPKMPGEPPRVQPSRKVAAVNRILPGSASCSMRAARWVVGPTAE